MADLQRVLRTIKNNLSHEREEVDPLEADARDRVTTDKYLRSLRRQYRVEQERVEKEQLKKELARIEKEKERKYLWGFSDGQEDHGGGRSRRGKKRAPPARKASYLSGMNLKG